MSRKRKTSPQGSHELDMEKFTRKSIRLSVLQGNQLNSKTTPFQGIAHTSLGL